MTETERKLETSVHYTILPRSNIVKQELAGRCRDLQERPGKVLSTTQLKGAPSEGIGRDKPGK